MLYINSSTNSDNDNNKASGEINYKDTTFSADYVGEDYENRLLLWGDKLLSTIIIIK